MSKPDDLLGTVKAELATDNPLEGLEPYIIADWLRALVVRCEQAEAQNMELRVQLRGEADARIGDIEQMSAEKNCLEHGLAAARAEAEYERLRLAACGVAAMGNTEAMVADRLTPDHAYYSASYGDVCRAVDREMAHRAEAARLREALTTIANMQYDTYDTAYSAHAQARAALEGKP